MIIDEILELITENEWMTYDGLLRKTNLDASKLNEVLTQLINRGEIYESRRHVFRKV